MKQYTDITVLLDRSGSMASIRRATEQGWRTFISEHRAVPTTKVTLIQFDSENTHDVVYEDLPVTDAQLLELRLQPRGSTPLLDAIGEAIQCTGERLSRLPERERPDQVLFVIITDGQENCSQFTNRRAIWKMIGHQRDVYRWQFIYLGANQDAIAEASTFNIPQGLAANYAATARGLGQTIAAVSANTMSYASRSTLAVPDFDDQQRKSMIDTLKTP